MKRMMRETLADFILSIDARIPEDELVASEYETARLALVDQVQRLHKGVTWIDEAETLDEFRAIAKKMQEICVSDIPEALANCVTAYLRVVLRDNPKLK